MYRQAVFRSQPRGSGKSAHKDTHIGKAIVTFRQEFVVSGHIHAVVASGCPVSMATKRQLMDWTQSRGWDFSLCAQLPQGELGTKKTILSGRVLQAVSLVIAGDSRKFGIVWIASPHFLSRVLCEGLTCLFI